MARSAEAKHLTIEEGLYAAFLVVLTLVCLVIAGKAYDQVMAFHATIGAVMAAIGVFLIFRSYFARPGGSVPLVIDGKR